MKIVIFCHSLYSDWNHGNAHFLRGITSDLLSRGIDVAVYEPENNWSYRHLQEEERFDGLRGFHRVYPGLRSHIYGPDSLDLDAVLSDASLVLVHEWNEHNLVRRLGEHRARNQHYRLFFHDTHHRAVTDPDSMARYDLRHYDGVLAFGETLRQIYLRHGWAQNVWTWHEAADTNVFCPHPEVLPEADLVWIGNWGDEERTAELQEFLLDPVHHLHLKARIFGVRYPEHARQALDKAGVSYGGWLPNYEAADIFARYRLTVHVPRRPYATALPGIPTIRIFEALASGIPLVSAPWEDSEHLFTPGQDFLTARNGTEMEDQIRLLLHDRDFASALAANGRRTILNRHTCSHRVDELLSIYAQLEPQTAALMEGRSI